MNPCPINLGTFMRLKKILLKRGALLLCLASPLLGLSATLTGNFTVIIPGTNINLTTIGPVDWVHWGQFTEFAYDRKFVASNLISDFTVLGNPNPAQGPFQRSDLSGGCNWQDGLQNSFATNTTTGTYLIGKNNGFSITIPVGNTTNVLKVYVASIAGGGNFTATLSDASAGPYSSSSANVVEGCYTLTNAGATTGGTLTVTWLGAGNSSVIVLQSAALAYLRTNNPPSATLSAPALDASIFCASNQVLQAVASDSDGTVSLVEFFAETNEIGQTTASPYSINWTNATLGPHSLTVKATDNLGASYTSKPLDVFVYTNGGTLTGSGAVPPGSIMLSDEGTNDWAHWGLNDATSFDHKAGVTQQISNFATIGTNTVLQYSDNLTAYSWVGGTPTDSASSSTTGVYICGFTNGFQLTVPAGRQQRTLKIYVGLYAARADFRAWLSDGSAPEFSDTTLTNFYDNAYQVYTLTYNAASDNQTLTIRHTAMNVYDSVFGNVTLQAGSLSLGPVPLSPTIVLTNIVNTPDSFSFSFGTDPGAMYQVWYTDTLSPPNWQLLTNFAGDGTVSLISDTNTDSSRFYQVERLSQ
jgi:hypothetical protein